ncbi:dihydrofolate reductase family protein [Chitinophaga sp. Cy-1792]|uniref:dihydrofolate reductase family protein n=1 Tax=Chitinophaga sp. Cy-1792 TaxID=2608339 RepID=UPI001420F7DA|nr:dihydrofolate reductase family protein [Chitinophaga sp. Cy-1792]NIG55566.1 dihydrofolate reductase [Chitinophaga sp. Cy-1792]
MRKLVSFQFITLNGYFEDAAASTAWAIQSMEQRDYALNNMEAENILLFGRITYEHMIAWWPTNAAIKQDPEMAAGMNNAEKIVFSNTLKNVSWQNTRVVGGDITEEIRRLKNTPGKNLCLLGSGSILTLFAAHDLVDEFQLMINPVALGNGHSIFKGLAQQLNLQLLSSKVFSNGVVVLTYIPVRK